MSELPKGWKSCSLDELIISLESGSRPKGGVRGIQDGVPSIGGEHITNEGTFDFSNIKYVPKSFAHNMSKGHIKINDVLIVKDGATTGKTVIVTSEFPFSDAVVNEHVFICRPAKSVHPKFLFRYLYSQEGQNRILENFQGSAQGGINRTFISNTDIPLPTLNEQHRIVVKLEKLLSRVNYVRTRLAKISLILKRFRQSVITAACSGQLSFDWRFENNAQPWRDELLGNLILYKPKNGYSVNPVKYETPYKVLTLTATTSGRFKPEHFKYFDELIPGDSHLWLEPGDILVQRGNTIEYVGVSAIYDGKRKQFIYPDLMMKLRPKNNVSAKYLYLALSCERTRNYLRQNATGTAGNMPKINQQVLVNAPVSIPSLEEQEEIVCRVESLFKTADALESRYLKTRTYIDKLTQSILSSAFRGELVPQDPHARPASLLLERNDGKSSAAARKSNE